VEVTRRNVCKIYGHDVRWRRVAGPMLPGARRPAVLVCLDCGRAWLGKEEIR